MAEAACVVLARAPPAVAFPTEDLKARRAAARKAARRRRFAGRRVCVKNVGADQCRNQKNFYAIEATFIENLNFQTGAGTLELADGALRLRDDRGHKHAFDSGCDFVLLSPRDAVWQARYVIGALALAAFLAPPGAATGAGRAWLLLATPSRDGCRGPAVSASTQPSTAPTTSSARSATWKATTSSRRRRVVWSFPGGAGGK